MKEKRNEQGITLIALIITIILLLMLAAVAIKALTGDEGLIDSTITAKENYNVETYREQINGVVQGEVIAYANKGEDATIGQIEQGIKRQEWVKDTKVHAEEGIPVPYILVQVDAGYVYQVFYDSIYGKLQGEYLGPEPGEEIDDDAYPVVKAKYDQTSTSILATATVKKGKIVKLELIQNGKIIRPAIENPEGEQTFKLQEGEIGWFEVKATADTRKSNISNNKRKQHRLEHGKTSNKSRTKRAPRRNGVV